MQTLVQGNWPQLQQLQLCACVPDDRLCCSGRSKAGAIREYPRGERLFSSLATGNWPKLAALDVSGNQGFGNGMADLVKGPWPALTSLDMTDSFQQVSSFDSIIDFSKADAPALASLSLGTDSIWEWRPACLRISSRVFPHLTELDLHGTELLDYSTGSSCLVQGDWPILGHLNLKNTSNAEAVLAQGKWPQLVQLQLDGGCAYELAMLDRANFPALRYLELSNQALGYGYTSLEYYVSIILPMFGGSLSTLVVSGLTVWEPVTAPYLPHTWPPNMALGLVIKADTAVLESLSLWPVTSVKLDPPSLSMALMGFDGPRLGNVIVALIKSSFVMLQHLDLSSLNHMNLCSSFIADIASGHWPVLRTLLLDDNHLDDASLSPLTKGDWPVLTMLSLRENHLSEEAVKLLVRGNWPMLGTLQVCGNDFYPSSTINGLQASACFEQLFPEVSSHMHAKWPTISLPSYRYFPLMF
ncbi:hypothetical protein ABBQ38_013407 [Trebouxia sp. C0009 RCD-2024]